MSEALVNTGYAPGVNVRPTALVVEATVIVDPTVAVISVLSVSLTAYAANGEPTVPKTATAAIAVINFLRGVSDMILPFHFYFVVIYLKYSAYAYASQS